MTWATIAAGLWRALTALAGLLPYLGAWWAGRRSRAAADAEDALDDIRTAELARDRLRSDPEYADRVRERFSR